jgi:hypothetical protein
MKEVLRYEHSLATTMDERLEMRRKFRNEIRNANPLVSRDELKPLLRDGMLEAALEWRRNVLQSEKDSLLSSSLAEKKKEDELLMRGPAQDALLAEFARSLTMAESSDLYSEVKEAHPNAPAKELGRALRAFKLQAALVWHRKRAPGGKDSSLPLPRPLPGTAKLTEPLSLEAQPKSDASTKVKYSLSLTKEERTPVFFATKLANPDADTKHLTRLTKLLCGKQTA